MLSSVGCLHYLERYREVLKSPWCTGEDGDCEGQSCRNFFVVVVKTAAATGTHNTKVDNWSNSIA